LTEKELAENKQPKQRFGLEKRRKKNKFVVLILIVQRGNNFY
jgi:hypothetical protein